MKLKKIVSACLALALAISMCVGMNVSVFAADQSLEITQETVAETSQENVENTGEVTTEETSGESVEITDDMVVGEISPETIDDPENQQLYSEALTAMSEESLEDSANEEINVLCSDNDEQTNGLQFVDALAVEASGTVNYHPGINQRGYEVAGCDANKHVGGKYIYIGYHSRSDFAEGRNLITGLLIVKENMNGQDITYNGKTYKEAQRLLDSNGDLNQGAGGEYLYLYYTNDGAQEGAPVLISDGFKAYGVLYFGEQHINFVREHWNYVVLGYTPSTGRLGTGQDLNGGIKPRDVFNLLNVYLVAHYHTHDTNGTGGSCSVCGYEPYGFVVTEAKLREKIETQSTGTITLGADIDLTDTLEIPEGKNITIDLNGFKLNQTKSDSEVILNFGTLTIKDSSDNQTGAITGGTSSGVITNGFLTLEGGSITSNKSSGNGGGVLVNFNGSFTMTGGTISKNTAYDGGGVYNYGTFVMQGGTISDNTASNNGGGVYNDCNPDPSKESLFRMRGGAISGNHAARSGGGVYNCSTFDNDARSGGSITANTAARAAGFDQNGTMIIYGSLQITDNKLTDGTNCNLFLEAGKTVQSIRLLSSARIGFTADVDSSGERLISDNFANYSDSLTKCLFCDNDQYTIKYSNIEGRKATVSMSVKSQDTNEKIANPMQLKATSKKLNFKTLKTKKLTTTISFKTKDQGKVTYILSKAAKKAKITVTSKGKITVPK